MRSQPLPGDASRRRAEEQFKTTKKVNSETKANTPSRLAEAAICSILVGCVLGQPMCA